MYHFVVSLNPGVNATRQSSYYQFKQYIFCQNKVMTHYLLIFCVFNKTVFILHMIHQKQSYKLNLMPLRAARLADLSGIRVNMTSHEIKFNLWSMTSQSVNTSLHESFSVKFITFLIRTVLHLTCHLHH